MQCGLADPGMSGMTWPTCPVLWHMPAECNMILKKISYTYFTIRTLTKVSFNQMLGCGAHVRKIALPHVRCACGKGLELCVRKCVRMGIILMCDLRSHFFTCFTILKTLVHSFKPKMIKRILSIILDIFYSYFP